MRTELLEAVAQIITVSCYWIRVISTSEHYPYAIHRDEYLQYITCRHLTLEVTHSRGQHYIGHRWHIAEFELDKVLSDMMKADPKLRNRCKKLCLTLEDVEALIKRATYGIIELDMLDDNFVPLAFRH